MGKQYDKVIKRRRRLAYLERKKEKAKETALLANKPKIRKPKAKVEEPPPVKEPAPKKAPKPKPVPSEAASAEPTPAEPASAEPTAVDSIVEETAPEATALPETNLAEAPADDTSSAPAE